MKGICLQCIIHYNHFNVARIEGLADKARKVRLSNANEADSGSN